MFGIGPSQPPGNGGSGTMNGGNGGGFNRPNMPRLNNPSVGNQQPPSGQMRMGGIGPSQPSPFQNWIGNERSLNAAPPAMGQLQQPMVNQPQMPQMMNSMQPQFNPQDMIRQFLAMRGPMGAQGMNGASGQGMQPLYPNGLQFPNVGGRQIFT